MSWPRSAPKARETDLEEPHEPLETLSLESLSFEKLCIKLCLSQSFSFFLFLSLSLSLSLCLSLKRHFSRRSIARARRRPRQLTREVVSRDARLFEQSHFRRLWLFFLSFRALVFLYAHVFHSRPTERMSKREAQVS